MIKRLYKPLRCVYHRFIVSIILYLVHDLCLRPPETLHSWIKLVFCELFLSYQ